MAAFIEKNLLGGEEFLEIRRFIFRHMKIDKREAQHHKRKVRAVYVKAIEL